MQNTSHKEEGERSHFCFYFFVDFPVAGKQQRNYTKEHFGGVSDTILSVAVDSNEESPSCRFFVEIV